LKVLREGSGWASRIKEDIVRPIRGRGDHCDIQDISAPSRVNGLLGVHLGFLLLGAGHSLFLPAGARGRGVQRYELLRVLTCLLRRALWERDISGEGSDSLNSYPKETAGCLSKLLEGR
jgi:hypothetical protein